MAKQNPIERIEAFQAFGSVLGLERMERLMEKLGNPQDTLRILHVAGTNGKGSVCRYLTEVLREAGYSVGLFTSPFLEDFRERIELDGEMISMEDLDCFTDRILAAAKTLVDAGMDSPTEFEIITAIAFDYFAARKPDFVVLEVGLGGRGDSTNIVKKPLVTIITSVGHDHMDRLGNTLPEIAAEKAGILKPGVPLVMRVDDPDAASVIARRAYALGAPLTDAGRLVPKGLQATREGSLFTVEIGGIRYERVEIVMAGEHQVGNALTALAAIEILRKSSIIKVNLEGLQAGMKRARMKGRFEISGSNPCYVLDGAHNREGIEALVHAVDRHLFGKKILWVVGFLADKEVDRMLACLAAYEGGCGRFIAAEPDSPRKLPAAALARRMRQKRMTCLVGGTPRESLALARTMEGSYDAILFTGSLYMIGEIRKALQL